MEDSRYLISKLTTKFTVINTLWCWLKGRQIDQWNGIKILEIDMQLYGQLIFTHIKVIQRRKRSSFNKGTGTTGYSYGKKPNFKCISHSSQKLFQEG